MLLKRTIREAENFRIKVFNPNVNIDIALINIISDCTSSMFIHVLIVLKITPQLYQGIMVDKTDPD